MVKRQEQWKEQERVNEANKPDPDCPKGHKRVPEDERRKVLAKLKKSEFIELFLFSNLTQLSGQDELEIELGSLPVRQCDTLKYKQRKMDIEVKLNELDEAVKVSHILVPKILKLYFRYFQRKKSLFAYPDQT